MQPEDPQREYAPPIVTGDAEMEGQTDYGRRLSAEPHRAELIVAAIDLRYFLESHEGMPSLGATSLPLSFRMPAGDDAKIDRLAGIAAWLNVTPENRDGTFWAYRDFGGLRLGGHFTPQHIQVQRARQLLHGMRAAA